VKDISNGTFLDYKNFIKLTISGPEPEEYYGLSYQIYNVLEDLIRI
jgi:hypothetical protein